MTKDKTQIVRMEEDLHKRTKEMANRKGISVSGLIRMYLIEGLDRDEKKG